MNVMPDADRPLPAAVCRAIGGTQQAVDGIIGVEYTDRSGLRQETISCQT